MKKLGFFVRFIFICILLLSGVISIAQTPVLTNGLGTEADPYQISSVSDWNAFAAAVNAGYSYSGDFIKLTANLCTL